MNLSVYTKEFSYNAKLAYPIILSMLGHTLVGVIDNIMVGKIGATELAAASLANSFVFIGISIIIGFSSAITPLVAYADTEGNIEQGSRVFYSGFWLCTLLGVLSFVGLYWFKPYIALMNQPKDVLALAYPFLDVVALSLIPLGIFQSIKQFTDGKSLTKYSMYATIISNVLNVLFNYLLIYGIWFFPKMGIMGVAYGTLISRVVMLLYIVYIIYSKKVFYQYIEKISGLFPDKDCAKRIIKIGIPSSMQSLFEVGLFTAAVWVSGMLGKTEQAANQIALSMASMTFMFASGLSVAAMIRVGNMMGIKDYQRAKIISKSIMLMTTALYIILAILFIVFHENIPLLFLDNNDLDNQLLNAKVVQIAGKLLMIAGFFQIADGIQVVALGSLRGMQDVNIPMIITLISYWIIGFSLVILLAFYTPLRAEGIWYGLLAGLFAAALFLYIRFEIKTNQLIKTKQ